MKYKLLEIALFNPIESVKKGIKAKKVAMNKTTQSIWEYDI